MSEPKCEHDFRHFETVRYTEAAYIGYGAPARPVRIDRFFCRRCAIEREHKYDEATRQEIIAEGAANDLD